jgi:hypothetical protein
LTQHVAGSRLTSNIKITLKITFTSEIFADITRSLAIVQLHLKFFKKILILIFFSDLFSVECKFFCPNSADNTMENRAISLVESSGDNSLIACRTSSATEHRFKPLVNLLHNVRVMALWCFVLTAFNFSSNRSCDLPSCCFSKSESVRVNETYNHDYKVQNFRE